MRKLFRKITVFCLSTMLMMGMAGCERKEETATAGISTTQSEVTESNAKEQEANEAATGGFTINLVSNNSWENNGMQCTQFDGVIRNQSGTNASDWKVKIAIPDGSKLENGWNGTYELNGTVLEITPVDYNKELAAGSEITFGFILDTPQSFTPKDCVLSIAGNDYALGGDNEVSNPTKEDTSEAKDEKTTEAKEAAAKDTTGTPVSNHGVLSVKGTDIVDKDGKIFQLKGVSTHGINWFPDYVNKEAFADLSSYGVNAIRLAMYTADYNGYCSGGNQRELEDLIDKGVRACTELGLYVIVDWHILNDNDPNQNKESAKTFFDTMSKKYASYDNILYEICNEPNGGTTWDSIKLYSEEVIPVIRKNDKDAIIIVGTPNWSQDVDIASQNKIENQKNIVYAVHFYASTHKEQIRDKVETARKNGLPVIISESSICEASGNGSINYEEADKWMDLINKYHLSVFAWNLSNKDEQSSFLKPSVTKTSGFTKDDFSETGSWYLEKYSK